MGKIRITGKLEIQALTKPMLQQLLQVSPEQTTVLGQSISNFVEQ